MSDFFKSEDGKYLYTLNNDGCSLRGVLEQPKVLIIPESINGITVSVVSAMVFQNGRDIIEEVVFPNTVTHLEYKTFEKMSALKKVVFSGTISILPKDSFVGCISLEEIVISKRMNIIQDFAVHDCNNLRRVIIYSDDLLITENSFVNYTFHSIYYDFVYPDNELDDGTPDYRQNLVYRGIEREIQGNRKSVILYVHEGSETEKRAKACGYKVKSLYDPIWDDEEE